MTVLSYSLCSLSRGNRALVSLFYSIYQVMEHNTQQLPGYTVPIIDLAFAAEHQFIVDREPGQYLGHPTSVLLKDGKTIIVVYPKGHGRGSIVMKRSVDGGLTWSDRLPTPDNWDTSMETPTIYPVTDRQGVDRLIMFSGGLFPVRMAVSEDNGDTWSPLKPIGNYGGIVAMADLVQLKDGTHRAFFHGKSLRFAGEYEDQSAVSPDFIKYSESQDGRTSFENEAHKWQIWQTVSKDGGLTWGEPVVAVEHDSAGICEPGVFRSPDGRQLAMLLRENTRKMNSFVSFSDDEGTTWSPPRELPGSLTGDRHQGCYTPDGRLFISFRDTCLESLTQGDWVAWVGTYEDIVNGSEGQYRVRLMQNSKSWDCAYPAVELLPDGTIVTLTYGHWNRSSLPYIAGLRFTMDQLDRKPRWVYQGAKA